MRLVSTVIGTRTISSIGLYIHLNGTLAKTSLTQHASRISACQLIGPSYPSRKPLLRTGPGMEYSQLALPCAIKWNR
jgi:hypothetical protein